MARWTAQLLSWVVTLIVARRLSPEDYGIAAMANSVVSLAGSVSELGLGAAVVTFPTLTTRQVAQLNSVGALVGLAAAAMMVALSSAIAAYFAEPRAATVVAVLGLTLLLEALRAVPVGMMSRHLDYRGASQMDFLRASSAALATLLLAWLGGGYWSLILGVLFGSAVVTGLVMVRYRQPFLWPSSTVLREPLRYCRHLMVGRASWTAYSTADTFVVGRLLGAAPLGLYTLAKTIVSLPGEKLVNVLQAALGPFFAAIRRDQPRLQEYFLQVTQAIALVVFPLLVGLALVADLVVPLLLGARYSAGVPILRMMIPFAAVSALAVPVGHVLNVTGLTGLGMRTSFLGAALLIPGFIVGGLAGGLGGVAVAWAVLLPLSLVPATRATMSQLSLSGRDLLACLWPSVAATAVMSVMVLSARALPLSSSSLRLGALIALGALTYLATIAMAFRQIPANLGALLRAYRT